MGASKLPSVPFWVGSSFQHTELGPRKGEREKAPAGARTPAGAKTFSLYAGPSVAPLTGSEDLR